VAGPSGDILFESSLGAVPYVCTIDPGTAGETDVPGCAPDALVEVPLAPGVHEFQVDADGNSPSVTFVVADFVSPTPAEGATVRHSSAIENQFQFTLGNGSGADLGANTYFCTTPASSFDCAPDTVYPSDTVDDANSITVQITPVDPSRGPGFTLVRNYIGADTTPPTVADPICTPGAQFGEIDCQLAAADSNGVTHCDCEYDDQWTDCTDDVTVKNEIVYTEQAPGAHALFIDCQDPSGNHGFSTPETIWALGAHGDAIMIGALMPYNDPTGSTWAVLQAAIGQAARTGLSRNLHVLSLDTPGLPFSQTTNIVNAESAGGGIDVRDNDRRDLLLASDFAWADVVVIFPEFGADVQAQFTSRWIATLDEKVLDGGTVIILDDGTRDGTSTSQTYLIANPSNELCLLMITGDAGDPGATWTGTGDLSSPSTVSGGPNSVTFVDSVDPVAYTGTGGAPSVIHSRWDRDCGDVVVDKNHGLDTNPGNSAQPFISISHAIAVLGDAGGTICLLPGTYEPGLEPTTLNVPGNVHIVGNLSTGGAACIPTVINGIDVQLAPGATVDGVQISP
jgi:hypothetical protein